MKRGLMGLGFAAVFAAASAFAAVDLNTATQEQLEAVKGIGPAKAKAIIEYRTKNGAFKTLDDLDKVKGFGKKSIDKLKNDLSVGGKAAPAAKAATPAAPAKPATPAAPAKK